MSDVSKGEGRTILFVSHNMAAVNTLCRQVLLLENGLNTFLGSTQSGIKKYLHQNSLSLNNRDIKNLILKLPADEVFELLTFSVVQEDSNGFEFHSDSAVKILIEYTVKKETMGLR
jgi:lipopolysaccharide transport system ATP-binding protein